MAAPPPGKPLPLPRPEPIKKPDASTLGYGWELSEDARRDIEAIETNVRQAEQGAGELLVR